MKKPFTLLEVAIGLSLLLLVAGLMSWKFHTLLEKKRFRVDVENLRSRLLTCQQLAVNAQIDWVGILSPKGKGWEFASRPSDGSKQGVLPPLALNHLLISFEGKKVGTLGFEFFAGGETSPKGTLLLKAKCAKGPLQERWNLSELFQREEGEEGSEGPLKPQEGDAPLKR